MKAKNVKLVKPVRNTGLSKNQLAEVVKREESRLAESLRSVVVAGSADKHCMLALHTLYTYGLKCTSAVKMAIESLGTDGAVQTIKNRKTRLLAIAEAVDAKKMVNFKGTPTTVGSLLASRNPETGAIKAASLQGVFALLKPKADKTMQQHRDWVNEQVLQMMQRDLKRGGGRWVLDAKNVAYLIAELTKKEKETEAAAKALAEAKAAA